MAVSLRWLYGSQRFRVMLVTCTELQKMVALFRAFKGPIMSIFQPRFTAHPNLMIPSSPPRRPLCSSSSPPSSFLYPPLTPALSPFHLSSHFSQWLTTSAYRSPRARKSITSSRHCLNFQLMTLRSVSPDTSITSDQPSKHQIRRKNSQAEARALARNAQISKLHCFIQTMDQDYV